jgi:hypothetical protein
MDDWDSFPGCVSVAVGWEIPNVTSSHGVILA